MAIERAEVYRYLGYRSREPEAAVVRLTESCLEELAGITPHSCTRRLPLTAKGSLLTIGEITVVSGSLAAHLSSCREVFLLAATLGAQADWLLQRCEKLSMSRAVVMQACAAAAIEAYCDEVQEALEKTVAAEGLYLRARFSPGYGDFPLSHQRELLALLEAGKRIGLTATDSSMLVPTKSVTAVIGLTADAASCHTHHCAACPKTNCPFRKEGETA